MKSSFAWLIVLSSFSLVNCGQSQHFPQTKDPIARIRPGAERIDAYLPLLQHKKVGIFANHTSLVGKTHLVDTLMALGVKVELIFAPEHGFRGEADAGEKVGNTKDPKTGIDIISLYGSKRRPSVEELARVDLLIFDIQDVGLRYYTYISSLEEYMIAAFENAKPLLVLDRPNPNGFYVDGPVLEKPYRSFVGMQAVPVVYGMTIGEYGMMLAGEGWLTDKANRYMQYADKTKPTKDTAFHFMVIKCEGYEHKSYYELPVAPSPNLPDMQSVLLYSSTCYFEGTDVSLGRGTPKPFQVYGHPTMPKELYSFTPRSMPGAKEPPHTDVTCYGADLSGEKIDITRPEWQRIQLRYLLDAYRLFPDKSKFFLKPSKKDPQPQDYFFNKLAGNGKLMEQIVKGVPEDEIRKSWDPGLKAFKEIRKKYLLYPDFE
ncbi:MAG TPA: DUF1343 domain-containing protein [Phnomibacter sp.]|nr:DUF1343 domain-containing protein [Phnomibacter sp.]